jgi:hypothetical protein
LARACNGKAEKIYQNQQYTVNNQTFEIDLATRNEDRIVLFEIKAKSLTSKARSGDMMTFYSDYTNSYLAMVGQLVRHENHLRQGLTPLTGDGEICCDFRTLKIAVSPISYGPVSDKMLANNLLRAFHNITLYPLSNDAECKRITDAFNKAVRKIFDGQVYNLAPKGPDGKINLFAYFLDIFWMDLGQVLYLLDRSKTVTEAFTKMQFLTYRTHDLWTEIAFVDGHGLTKGR